MCLQMFGRDNDKHVFIINNTFNENPLAVTGVRGLSLRTVNITWSIQMFFGVMIFQEFWMWYFGYIYNSITAQQLFSRTTLI